MSTIIFQIANVVHKFIRAVGAMVNRAPLLAPLALLAIFLIA